MAKQTGESEYGGGGVMPNGVFPQEDDVIPNATDQLMLLARTGQRFDTHAPVDPYLVDGISKPEPPANLPATKFMKRSERYRQSQY